MKRTDLKQLIKETVQSTLKERFLSESKQDPTREEMLHFLEQQFGREEGFEDNAEVSMYWFANDYHGGQWSNLYSVLSTSPFSPGPIANGPEPDSVEEMMYQALEAEYGGKQAGEVDEANWTDDASYMQAQGDSSGPDEPPTSAQLVHSTLELVQLFKSGNRFVTFIENVPGQFSIISHKSRKADGVDKTKSSATFSIRELISASYRTQNPNSPGLKQEMTTTGAVQGYMTPKAFSRKRISEEEQPEPHDPETDTFAPGPRQRPEDWKQGGDPKKRQHDLGLLKWAIARLQREPTSPRHDMNVQALTLVIKMLKKELGL